MPDTANVTIFHLTCRENWQDQRRRSTFALAQHGISVNAIELVKPTEQRLEEAWKQHCPDVVFNHAFVIKSASIIRMSQDHTETTVVTVDHSNQNHTFTWPHYLKEMRLILEAGQKIPNAWMASPDAYMPFADLGYQQYIHWPNPVHLPPVPTLPAPLSDPPILAIVGRTDWMKAFPAQIAAAALVQQRRPLRVVLVLNGDADRKAGLHEHAQACRLKFETPAWMNPTEWEAYLRDRISVVCQPSFSESFNYVSLDGTAFGRPFVGSESIRHTPAAWMVHNPNDCYEIAAKIEYILDHYPDASNMARQVAEMVAARNNQQYANLVRSCYDPHYHLKDLVMPRKPRSSEVKQPVCHFHGPEIGSVKCSCPGSATVHACYHEQVPSRKCCDTMPANWIDGPIKLRDGSMTEERFIPFPYDQKSIDKGHPPWDNWVLCCDVCPHRTGPPEQVQSLYDQRNKLTGLIARYENAPSIEERETLVRDLAV